MGELRRTSYRPRSVVLGSRQQLCAHPRVSRLPSAAAVNQGCRAAVASGACGHHARTEPYLRQNPDANSEPLDVEDLMKRVGRVELSGLWQAAGAARAGVARTARWAWRRVRYYSYVLGDALLAPFSRRRRGSL